MKQGYNIEITNCAERDLTLEECQDIISTARTLDTVYTHNNPLVIENSIKIKFNYVQGRNDLIKVSVYTLI